MMPRCTLVHAVPCMHAQTYRTHGALMYPRPCRRSGGMRFSVQRGAPCQPCGRGDQAVCSETKLCKVVISHSPLAAPSHLLHKLQRQIQYRILEPFSTVSRVQVKAAIHREWVAVNNQSMQNGTALLLTPLPFFLPGHKVADANDSRIRPFVEDLDHLEQPVTVLRGGVVIGPEAQRTGALLSHLTGEEPYAYSKGRR